jgi:hypothetical protein
MPENTGHNLPTAARANEKARAFHLQAISQHALVAPNWRQCSAEQMETYGIRVADIRKQCQKRATRLLRNGFGAGVAWLCLVTFFNHISFDSFFALFVYGAAAYCGLLVLAARQRLGHRPSVQYLAWLLAWVGPVLITMMITGMHTTGSSLIGVLFPVMMLLPETRARLSSFASDCEAVRVATEFSENLSIPFMGSLRAFEVRWRSAFERFIDNQTVEVIDVTGTWVGTTEFDFVKKPLTLVLKRIGQGRFEGTVGDSQFCVFISGDRFIALRRHVIWGLPGWRATKFLGTWDEKKRQFSGECSMRNEGIGIFVLSRPDGADSKLISDVDASPQGAPLSGDPLRE